MSEKRQERNKLLEKLNDWIQLMVQLRIYSDKNPLDTEVADALQAHDTLILKSGLRGEDA